MQFLCSIIGHRRSRSWARRYADTWRSHCTRCGTRMQRVAPRQWIEVTGQEDNGSAG